MAHWPPFHLATVQNPYITLQLAFHICSYMFQDPSKHKSCGTVASTYWKISTYMWSNEFKSMLFKCLLYIHHFKCSTWVIYTYTHTQWNIIQPWEEGNPCICYYWIYHEHIMLSEIRQTRQILYAITYRWNLKKTKLTHRNRGGWFLGGRRLGR